MFFIDYRSIDQNQKLLTEYVWVFYLFKIIYLDMNLACLNKKTSSLQIIKNH